MGQSCFNFQTKQNLQQCLDVVKEERCRTSLNLVHPGLDFNSQLEGFIDCFAKATTLNELVQELQFIWLPSWNTLQRKFLNWQAMLLVITRKLGSSQDISSWLSGTTKNWISYWLEGLLLKGESYLIFKPSCYQRRLKKARLLLNQKIVL